MQGAEEGEGQGEGHCGGGPGEGAGHHQATTGLTRPIPLV